METISKVEKIVKDSNDVRVMYGDSVKMNIGGMPVCAVFCGIGKRGAWQFTGTDEYSDLEFSVQPRTVVSMYKVF